MRRFAIPMLAAGCSSYSDNLPGMRISPTIYEVYTADWDEGLWDEEVEHMGELVDPATDTLIFWHVFDGKLTRTVIAGRLA
jgi:hypothetical protein